MQTSNSSVASMLDGTKAKASPKDAFTR